jgi:carbon monoxide dehydrogenase subunit G
MKVEGVFPTDATVAQLHALFASPASLETVPCLAEVVRTDSRTLRMVFTPRLALGPVPLATAVVTTGASAERVELKVCGRHGAQMVDVALVVCLAPTELGTTVSWTADVVVRGAAASVGQRVAGDLAARAIGDLLASAALAATGVAA